MADSNKTIRGYSGASFSLLGYNQLKVNTANFVRFRKIANSEYSVPHVRLFV
jgi:hypothetical protein